jgi:hypothetical protein
MYCAKCGAQLATDSTFCGNCGTQNSAKSIEPAAAPPASVTPLAPPPAPNPPQPTPYAAQPIQYAPPNAGFVCPFCHYQGAPISEKKISGSGWVIFVLLLLFCLPLCWLPFVIDGCKEETRRCASCGTKLG